MTKNSADEWAPFFYDLPAARIAQRPVYPPESAKLLVSESSGTICDRHYSDLDQLLRSGDLLVFNHTQVSPARVRGVLSGGGSAEFLLLRKTGVASWSCLARPLKKLSPGVKVTCGENLSATIQARLGEKELEVSFESHQVSLSVEELIDQVGEMPIPPYIRKGHADQQDRVDYQSIFAQIPGSVAAPTASLHFSHSLMNRLEQSAVLHAGVVLHLGSASFLPVYDPERSAQLAPPGTEFYIHSDALLEKLAQTKASGGRIVAVGTSVVRALETMIRNEAADGALCESNLFITPGFEFQVVDILMTNFHQPGTTHLLLVESFIGNQRLQAVYSHALTSQYRFLSYGDGMILYPGKKDE